MDDLISRSALIEAMPKDDILMSLDVRRCICDAPAVDAFEVVRCNDCVAHGNCITEGIFNFCRKHDGFCCVGKRKEQEHGNEY